MVTYFMAKYLEKQTATDHDIGVVIFTYHTWYIAIAQRIRSINTIVYTVDISNIDKIFTRSIASTQSDKLFASVSIVNT